MSELPGVWESLIVDYVGDVLGGDEAQYSCSAPDGGLKFEVTIPHSYKTKPDIQQRIRELFRHRGLPAQGLTIRIPASQL
jgi:hypothetical protein